MWLSPGARVSRWDAHVREAEGEYEQRMSEVEEETMNNKQRRELRKALHAQIVDSVAVELFRGAILGERGVFSESRGKGEWKGPEVEEEMVRAFALFLENFREVTLETSFVLPAGMLKARKLGEKLARTIP